jgi:hypothetical protein
MPKTGDSHRSKLSETAITASLPAAASAAAHAKTDRNQPDDRTSDAREHSGRLRHKWHILPVAMDGIDEDRAVALLRVEDVLPVF